MEMKEIVGKIGKEKLQAAIKSGDDNAVAALVKEAGVELTDEQLEYIAGGNVGTSDTDEDYVPISDDED